MVVCFWVTPTRVWATYRSRSRNLKQPYRRTRNTFKATISLAAANLRTNNLREAERLFKSALDKHPKSIEALLALGTFFAGTQRYGEAEMYFKEAFDLAPEDPRSLYALASFYSSTKRSTEAEGVFSQAIRRKPNGREPYWGLASFYFQQGANEKGISALLELLKAMPGDRQAQVRLAEAYLNSREQLKSEQFLQSVLKTYPNDAEAHALMGRLLRERNEVDAAITHFDAAVKAADSLIPPYIEKANLQMLGGHIDNASETLTAALQRDKNNMLVRGFLAKVLALQQKPQDAIREASIVLAAMPSNEDAMVARGDALLKLGNFEEAVKQFRKLAELRPNYSFYWHRLGGAESLHGETAASLVHLRKAVELKPDLAQAITDLIVLHSQLKQYDEALGELDRLPKVSIPTDEIHRLRGQVYAAKGDAVAAEHEFQSAIEVNPNGYSNYMALAQLSLTRKDHAQAMREVDRLITRDSRLPQAFFLKAYLLQLRNDIAGAILNYRKVLDLDPENPEASNNLAWLLSEDPKNLTEALGLAQKARRTRPEDPEMADTLGWVYYKMKSYTLAVDQLLFSLNNRSRPGAEHYYRLGAAYSAKGELQRANAMLRRSLQLNPSFPDAANARGLLESSR
jgi:putative PEP-CTERM system TPR-repeat lipoprotein